METGLKVQVAEKDKELAQLKKALEEAELTKDRFAEENKVLDSQKVDLVKETEIRYKGQIHKLESELEEKERESQDEMSQMQQQSEETLAQLKNFYEQEKERLERRLTDDKEKAEKRNKQLQEDFEE